MKKIISLILVLSILFGVILENEIVFATDEEISQSKALIWAKEQIGKSIDYDGIYGAQCVDLIKVYYIELGEEPVVANGYEYSYDSKLPEGWKKIEYYKGLIPQPGDIAVWIKIGSPYGHVAIVTAANEYGMKVIEQNGAAGQIVANATYSYETGIFYGIIRPSFTKRDFKNTPEDLSDIGLNNDKCVHRYTRIILKEANCTEDGQVEYNCPVCGYKYIDTLKRYGHTYDAGIITKKATCNEEGIKTYTCTECGVKYNEKIPRLEHNIVIDKEVKATFDKNGKTEGSHCSLCGKVLVEQKKTNKLQPPKTKISKITSNKKSFVIKWKKQTKNTTGYKIQYSTDKKFEKNKKTIYIFQNKTTSKTIKKLKGNKKYYVRIRTFKEYNGKKYYSSWSDIKFVKTKK